VPAARRVPAATAALEPRRHWPSRRRHAPARQQTKHDRKLIKELEREVRRKDKALAETAALLVLSKKVSAIFNKDKGEDE
jgi:transposase